MTRRRRLFTSSSSSLPLPAKLLRLPSLLGLSAAAAAALPSRLSRASLRFCRFLTSLFLFSAPFSAVSLARLLPSLSMDDLLSAGDCLFDLDRGSSSRLLLIWFPDNDSDDSSRERIYLVPYRWWKEIHDNSEEEVDGVLYSMKSVDSPDMHILLDLHREANHKSENEEEGFSGREFALIREGMWLRALKWHQDCSREENAAVAVPATDLMHDVFPLKMRLSIPAFAKGLLVTISQLDNPVEFYRKAFSIFKAGNDSLSSYTSGLLRADCFID